MAAKTTTTKSPTADRSAEWLHAARSGALDHADFNRRAYAMAVEAVADVLRPRLESGELRDWQDGDGDRALSNRSKKWTPPFEVLSAECERLFVVSMPAAALVLTYSSPGARRGEFDWRRDPTLPMQLAAAAEMARDVLALVR